MDVIAIAIIACLCLCACYCCCQRQRVKYEKEENYTRDEAQVREIKQRKQTYLIICALQTYVSFDKSGNIRSTAIVSSNTQVSS